MNFRQACNNIILESAKKKFHVAPSPIHGWGAFASVTLKKGEFIGLGFIIVNNTGKIDDDYEISELAKSINHSDDANVMIRKEHGNYYLYAKKEIDEGSELFINYANIPFKDYQDFYSKLKEDDKKGTKRIAGAMKNK